MPSTKAIEKELRATCDPKAAEYLIRNLHKPLNLELLKTACKMLNKPLAKRGYL
jgi:uncharacterized membrane protein YebE (DUF533 family)